MSFSKGEAVKHDISGIQGTVESAGHYPDTVIIKVASHKADENPRKIEVYLKHITKSVS